ncbi:MAG: T9SS type A sorting domain-containing protein [Bacteroidia bacterium]
MRKTFRLTISALLSFLFLGVNAQYTSYVHAYGGSSDEEAVGIVQTSSGDHFILANTESYGAGNTDIYLSKVNGLGEIQWTYAYGTLGNDKATSLTATSDGGFLVTGYSDGITTGSTDAGLLLKINSAGSLSWSKYYSLDSFVRLHGAVESRTGGYFVTGEILLDSLDANVLVSSVSTTGNIFWTKTYGGIKDDVGYDIAEDIAGKLVVVGTTKNDSIIVGSSGVMDVQVLRLDQSGNIDWIKNYGTSSDDVATRIKIDDEKYYVIGYTDGSLEPTRNALLMRVDSTSSLDYVTALGTQFEDRGLDAVTLSGNTLNLLMSIEGTTSANDLALVNLDNTGAVLLNFVYGGDSADGMSGALQKSSESGYSILGHGKSFKTGNNQNLFLIKTEESGSAECEEKLDDIQTFPISMSTNSYSNTTTIGLGFNPTITRTTVSEADTSLCCVLVARTAADSITMCEGDKINIGRQGVSGYTYSWTTNNSSYTSSAANPQVSPEEDTEYKLVVSDPNGNCVGDSATVYVTVNSRLTGIDFARDSFFCEGDDVTVTAYPGMNSYSWFGTGYAFSGQQVTFDEDDEVVLSVIDNNACVYLDTIQISEIPIPTFDLGIDTTICANLSITLSGPPNMEEYIWNGNSTSDQSFTTSSQQTHTLQVIDSFGCTYTDQIVIQTKPFATFDLGPDTSMCPNGQFVIYGPGALGGYIWNDTASSLQNLTVTQGGTYHLTAYNSFGCPYSDTVVIDEYNEPVFSLGNDTGYCEGGSVLLSGPMSMSSYLWKNGTDKDTLTVQGGQHWLTVTDDNGCQSRDTIVVVENPNPAITLGPDTTICIGESIDLSPGTGYAGYDWSTNESTATITVSTKGTYSVTVTDANNCSGSASVDVDTMTCDKESVFYLGDNKLRLYPNPASQVLNIDFDGSLAGAEIWLIDVQGRIILHKKIRAHQYSLDLTEVPNGLYQVAVRKDNNQIYSKVIVSH